MLWTVFGLVLKFHILNLHEKIAKIFFLSKLSPLELFLFQKMRCKSCLQDILRTIHAGVL